MTTRDFCIKWLAYILALLPVWFLESFVLSRFPLMGVKPMLLPFCVVAVATLEGATAGAGFGLGVGLLFDISAGGVPGAMILLMALLGLGWDFWPSMCCARTLWAAFSAVCWPSVPSTGCVLPSGFWEGWPP